MSEQADVEPTKGEQRAEEVGFADSARDLAEEESRSMTDDSPPQPQGEEPAGS